jgi:translation initiation factor IF-2
MQPRRLRLGDVVDDYCSRCRLLSNHAIAAIVDDAIKQTRCSTCDFEHPYKDGKLPVRRTKKDGTSALYKQVLDNVTDGVPDDQPSAVAKPAAPIRPALARPDAPRPVPVLPDTPAIDTPAAAAAPAPAAPLGPPAPMLVRPAAAAPPAPAAPLAAAPPSQPAEPRDDAGEAIVHRRLIRATLPRVEGAEREARPIPVFTVHEAANARGKFRRFPRPAGHGSGAGFGNGNGGNGNGNAMPRFGHGGQPSPFGAQGRGHGKGGGPRPNQGGGGQHGNRPNQQQRRGNKGR